MSCAFDIETTSFYDDNNNKCAIMYIWQFGINGNVLIGRSWHDFIILLKKLHDVLDLSDEKILYCYVHNLSYEFQFLRKWLNWLNVFAVDSRKPIKALCTYGIQFNDSYILSGYKLETVGKNLHKYKVKKLVGSLDYYKIRHNKTGLTEQEIQYCVNDVLVVMAYIQEYIEQENNKITNIPLTQTGAVRKFCRNNCFYGFNRDKNIQQQNYYNYRALMDRLTISDLNEYNILKRALQGGFVHANAKYINQTLVNVSSYDFTSSYLFCMLSEKYPMGKGYKLENVTINNYMAYSQNNMMVFDLHLIGVSKKLSVADSPISISRCVKVKNPIVNNGRVAYADELYLSSTNIDLQIYLNFYDIEHVEISNCYCYAKGYLPKNLILSILEVYKNKTELKGVKGAEREYLHNKELLNSMYGMCVTDIIQDLNTYDDVEGWQLETQNYNELLNKYNNSKNRFLFYPWGVFVTAYARKNLFSGILECRNDYIYSDTDSIKILNVEKHQNYFESYNKRVIEKLKMLCEHYNIDFDLCQPQTIKGDRKLIGVWDYEGTYRQFKTLGAKRYIYTDNNGLHATVAGVSKQGVVDYFNDTEKGYNDFTNMLIIPHEYTHKLTHTYIDDETRGVLTDYNGVTSEYHEKSFIHLEPTEYNLSIAQTFINYLKGIKNENIF